MSLIYPITPVRLDHLGFAAGMQCGINAPVVHGGRLWGGICFTFGYFIQKQGFGQLDGSRVVNSQNWMISSRAP